MTFLLAEIDPDIGPEGVLTEGSLRKIVERFSLSVVGIDNRGMGDVVVHARQRDQFAERALKAIDYLDQFRPCGVRIMIEPVGTTRGPYR